ncbi:uncharacterized protein NEMAJ01_2341 [Nematocida major]|uniref:uncharacterized protein n=1 Tax=Nematocida major TaxID=1912982 RepID=UPI0020075724|nr:uncharacterized protein NEMAJ01_2341 [Nematocida major]KAH9387445.1 hypothetical protein NEMAJ01_2341 [Nematocida major]
MKKRQTNYRERGQLEERKSLGALEKNRHFLERSRHVQEREEKIQNIKKLTAEANPDEYRHFMKTHKRKGIKIVKRETAKEKGPAMPQPEETPFQEEALSRPQRIVFTE